MKGGDAKPFDAGIEKMQFSSRSFEHCSLASPSEIMQETETMRMHILVPLLRLPPTL